MRRQRTPMAVAEECVPNIGLRGRRRRARNGLVALTAAGAFAIWASSRGSLLWWMWLLLAALYCYAMLGLFQAREKT